MKIVAGIGSIDEYEAYVEAGADELFCGYVPETWAMQQGNLHPLNRREVFYYNVQIGSKSELQILHSMIEKHHVPVTITLNSLAYTPEQYPQIAKIIKQCMQEGFVSFIVADPALLVYLNREEKIDMGEVQLHISGELGEVNHYMIEEMRKLGAKRIIFHRKNTLSDMKKIIQKERELHPENELEYEAFALNEMCHFNGAYCNSLHCDELAHICHLPYRLGKVDHHAEQNLKQEKKQMQKENWAQVQKMKEKEATEDVLEQEGYMPGATGCGLCALWKMREAGVTHLKLVSRGNYIEDTISDIRSLKKAITILEDSESEEAYIDKMKKNIFDDKCSGNCYYFMQNDISNRKLYN
ncbi:MAG: U32 family peptidase [Roseburia sp.]